VDYCKDVDDKFCGLIIRMLKELAFECAERNSIDHRVSKEEKPAGKECVIGFSRRKNLSLRMPEDSALGEK